MARNGRFRLALGASLAFLAFLLAGPVGDDQVKLAANLAQLLAPTLAAASCAWAAASGAGRTRRAWALLAGSAASWAVGQATWVWYEHLARRELPFPSLADVGYLVAIPLAAAAMLAFPGRAERAALRARSLLDGAVIAASLLYTSWALVLGPVFRAGEGGVLEQAIALAYPAGDVVLATIVFVVVARVRVGGAPVLLLGAGLLGLAVADTGFAYLTQEGELPDRGAIRRRLVPRLPAGGGRGPAAGRRREHLGRAAAGPAPGHAALLPPGPGRRHLGHPAAPGPDQRAVPVLDLRGPGAADHRPPAADRARQPDPQPPPGGHGRGAGAPGVPRRAHWPAQPGPVPGAGGARAAPPLPGRHPLALLFIDLDDFKTVNDQLGHAAGDDLLVAVAGRLGTCVRGEDTVARLGGDQFAILLEQAPSHEVAVRVAGRILEAMGPPFPLQGREVRIGASVGVTVSDAAEVDEVLREADEVLREADEVLREADEVLREADVAMYTAKARGKGRFELASTSASA